MDTTQTVTHISLCAGYGGIDIGLRGAIPNLRTVAFSEIEGFACANLVSKMEAGLLDCAPIWTDLKTFPWGAFRDRVDILSGGYPCQPFSAAGKRAGGEDERHLWPFISSGIRILRPRICFFENVEGHITCGLHHVLCDLGRLGYRTAWGIFSAREVGAPHQRKRVFILAKREGEHGWRLPIGEEEEHSKLRGSGSSTAWPSRPGQPQHGWEPPRVVGNADCFDRGTSAIGRIDDTEIGSAGEDGSEWQIESPLGRNFNESPRGMDYAELSVTCDNRTDELRLLGNGVVPATATLAFQTLLAELLNL